ncbi:hypothetical protein RGQ15_21665 [Paracoccus sp. MBLB3053]|uniref:Flagellar biosynthetic protein FliR n=1 Tax=Paracoccus aurantius TaxID=3073814 RepID=A0ABU2I033_9RHOB|nr:hypothetical protein [Paracoccus sp. MBLB3053]MDS9470165.1 hypothetical protein [Paracoccus sp. MBLB3053]
MTGSFATPLLFAATFLFLQAAILAAGWSMLLQAFDRLMADDPRVG